MAPTHIEGQEPDRFWWLPGFKNELRRRKLDKAFRALDKVIFSQESFTQPGLPFFGEDDRQYALLCKIDLLISEGRTHEALAWLCLEHQLHPDRNPSAESLRSDLLSRLSSRTKPKGAMPGRRRFSLGWNGVAGMEEVKLRFERDIILPLRDPDTYARYKLTPPNGILLWGPPGCGKTFLASKLAERLEYTFFEIKPSDVASIYIHGTVQKIAEVFSEAEQNAPAIVFIDELDAIAPARSGLDHHSYSEEVNQLLVQLNECSARGITVIGATNMPDRIDTAAKRPGRFDVLIYVPPPDTEAREELFALYLHDRPLAHGVDVTDLAIHTGGRTCVDIRHICDEAARAALEVRGDITHERVLQTIERTAPSISSEELWRYEELRQQER